MVYCLAQTANQGAEARCQPPEERKDSAWAVDAQVAATVDEVEVPHREVGPTIIDLMIYDLRLWL